jgi:predicted dinucleotide-binding enzyme
MKIGFIGAGKIGGTLARHFVALDHDVAISNSRGPETLADFVAELGPLASAVTTEEAIAFGDVLVVSVPLVAVTGLPVAGTEGKTLIDTCNYYPQRDGQIAAIDSGGLTESEFVAQHFAAANVVKAFNQIYWENLLHKTQPAGTPGRFAIPIAGNSQAAKRDVMQLIDQIGFDPIDAGELAAGRVFDNGGECYGKLLPAPELVELLNA